MREQPPTRRIRNEGGASAAEYALLASLIAVVILGSVSVFGTGVAGLFDRSCDDVSSATAGTSC